MRPMATVIAVSLATTVAAQGPPPQLRLPPQGSFSIRSGTQPVSGVAVATWVARVDSAGAHTLDLLVVWRGSPGWSAKPEQNRGGGGPNSYRASMTFGDVQLELAMTYEPRAVTIQGKAVPLKDENVILVDNVDGPGGPAVVRTLRLDPSMTLVTNGLPRIDEILRRSPDVVDFLQCSARMPDEKLQTFADIFCARVASN